MSEGEGSSIRREKDMDFMLKAMQQQFERLNVIFGEFRDRMDRQDILVANLQRNQAGRNADRRRPPDHDPLQINESEDEIGEREK